MSIEAIVKRKRKTRKGKGFSREELREVDLSFSGALRRGIPIDTRRSTKHEENVTRLKDYSKALRPQTVAEAPGSSEKRATRLVEDGRSLLNES